MSGLACNHLTRACPILTPRPLKEKGVYVSRIIHMDPFLAASIAGTEYNIVEESLQKIKNLYSKLLEERCVICGKRKAKHIVEVWDYAIVQDHGIAVLRDFVPVCDKCIQGIIFDPENKKEYKKAVKTLSKINKIKSDKVEEIINKMIEKWYMLSRLTTWRVYADSLEKYGIRKDVFEKVLRFIASCNGSLSDNTLIIFNRTNPVQRELLYEDVDALCTGRYNASTIGLKAMKQGIEPEFTNLREHIDTLLSSRRFCKDIDTALLLLEGAWVVTVSRATRAQVISRLLELLDKGDVWASRVETPLGYERDFVPILFYVSSFVDISLVLRVLEDVKKVLGGVKGVVEVRFYPRTPDGGLAKYHVYRYIIAG
ncbi:hypothetical protein PYJP_07590 [Pyrofollis japonicus]|uniref:hypothetical protein n=1 Tax=Pyrofollis japonicus TaxID=3060460 RepID=UPI00295BA608|nr:hypothetical protein [Pyrofollis japonicus]BEP17407.1 hypothetical protein PYJP_07590 [Pyrofollis japonicus]